MVAITRRRFNNKNKRIKKRGTRKTGTRKTGTRKTGTRKNSRKNIRHKVKKITRRKTMRGGASDIFEKKGGGTEEEKKVLENIKTFEKEKLKSPTLLKTLLELMESVNELSEDNNNKTENKNVIKNLILEFIKVYPKEENKDEIIENNMNFLNLIARLEFITENYEEPYESIEGDDYLKPEWKNIDNNKWTSSIETIKSEIEDPEEYNL